MSIGLSAGCLKLEAVLSRQTRHLGTLTWKKGYMLILKSHGRNNSALIGE